MSALTKVETPITAQTVPAGAQYTNQTPWRVPSPDVSPGGVNPLRLILNSVGDRFRSLPGEIFEQDFYVRKLFGRTVLYVSSPALFEDVFKTRGELFYKGAVQRARAAPLVGDGLIIAEGESWKRQRRIIAPIFRPATIAGFTRQLIDTTSRSFAFAPGETQRNLDDTFDLLRHAVISSLETCLFKPQQKSRLHEFPSVVSYYYTKTAWLRLFAILGLSQNTPFPGRRRFHATAQSLRTIASQYIAERIAMGGLDEGDDLASMLINAQDGSGNPALDERGVLDSMMNLILGGYETTALAVTWALYALASDPQLQEAAIYEIDRVTKGGALTPEAIDQLDLIPRILSESMRTLPPIDELWREPKEALTLAGVDLKPGDLVNLNIMALHRRDDIWPDASRFDPNRFLPEMEKTRPPFAFSGFGGGQRFCVAESFARLNSNVTLAVLVKNMSFALASDEPVGIIGTQTLFPSCPVQLRATSRPH